MMCTMSKINLYAATTYVFRCVTMWRYELAILTGKEMGQVIFITDSHCRLDHHRVKSVQRDEMASNLHEIVRVSMRR